MRRWLAKLGVVALLAMVLVPAHGQVVGVQPTPMATYYWNAGTNEWTACSNASSAQVSANTPQAIALYGLNMSLNQWSAFVEGGGCPSTGGGVAPTPQYKILCQNAAGTGTTAGDCGNNPTVDTTGDLFLSSILAGQNTAFSLFNQAGVNPMPIAGVSSSVSTNDGPMNTSLSAGGCWGVPSNVQGNSGSTLNYQNTLNSTVGGNCLIGGGFLGQGTPVLSTLNNTGTPNSISVTSVTLSGTVATVTTTPANTFKGGEMVTFSNITGGAATGMNGYLNDFQVQTTGLTSGQFQVFFNGAAGGPYLQSGATLSTTGDGLDVACQVVSGTSVCDPTGFGATNYNGGNVVGTVGVNLGVAGDGNGFFGGDSTIDTISINGYPQCMYLHGVNTSRLRVACRGTSNSTGLYLIDQWANGTGTHIAVEGGSGPTGSTPSVAAGVVRAAGLNAGTTIDFFGGNNSTTALWLGNWSNGANAATITCTQSGGVVSCPTTPTYGGIGYTTCPTLSVAGNGGSGSGASFAVTCIGRPGQFFVSGTTTLSGGSGYTSPVTATFLVSVQSQASVCYRDWESARGYFAYVDEFSKLTVTCLDGFETPSYNVGPLFYIGPFGSATFLAAPSQVGVFNAPTLTQAAGSGGYTASSTYYFATAWNNPCTTGGPWNTGPSGVSQPITVTTSGNTIQVASTYSSLGAYCAGAPGVATASVYRGTTNVVGSMTLIASGVTLPYTSTGNESPGAAPLPDNRPLWYAAGGAQVRCSAALSRNILTNSGSSGASLGTHDYAQGEVLNGEYAPSCNPGVVYVSGDVLPTPTQQTRDAEYCTLHGVGAVGNDTCSITTCASNGSVESCTWTQIAPLPSVGSGANFMKATTVTGTGTVGMLNASPSVTGTMQVANLNVTGSLTGVTVSGGRTMSSFCTSVASSSTVIYLEFMGGSTLGCSGTSINPPAVMPVSGTLSNLAVNCSAHAVAGAGVFTVYDIPSGTGILAGNLVNTGLTVTYSTSVTATTTIFDTTHTYNYAAGDRIFVSFTTGATETIANCSVSLNY